MSIENTDSVVRNALGELLRLGDIAASEASSVDVGGPGDPIFPLRYRIGSVGAAVLAATGVAASRLAQTRGGRRQTISVNTRAAAAALRAILYFRLDGARAKEHRDPLAGFYPVRDGRWIYLHCYFPQHRVATLKTLGVRDHAQAAAATVQWDGIELEDAIHAGGGCAGFVRSAAEWREHPQSQALRVEDLFEIIQVGDSAPEPLRSGTRPLEGVRVADLTRVLAGPVSTRTLAEFGADVLRITSPHLPNLGPMEYDYGCGKLSTELDLRVSGDAETLRQLVSDGDVFVQSYRPGSLLARGFGPEDLAALRPGLVYVTLDAWGWTGPWHDRRGYDSVVQCANGMVYDASPAEGKPNHVPAMPMDYLSGYLMAYGAMVALHRRATIGGSWLVRLSLARVGEWLRDFGEITPAEFVDVPTDLAEAEAESLSTYVDTAIGRLRRLKYAVNLSETPPFLSRPPVPFGTHSARWPAA